MTQEQNNQYLIDTIDGMLCPIDPQERLQCESCQ
jgi:hypothetical protein